MDGKVCVVTGAAGHLGKSMAAALCQAGAKVYLNGRRGDALEALRDALADEDVKVRQNAVRALSAIGDPADTLAVASLLTDGARAVRRTARSEIAAWARPSSRRP